MLKIISLSHPYQLSLINLGRKFVKHQLHNKPRNKFETSSNITDAFENVVFSLCEIKKNLWVTISINHDIQATFGQLIVYLQ
jgi:hypothetical protein